jgi:NADH:ubiquinone oxidoreductase subunit E
MVNVEICIGSACYVKGSNQVVEIMKDIIAENHWEDKVSMKGSFCMKACQRHIGLGIRINGRQLENVTLQNCRERLTSEIQAELA